MNRFWIVFALLVVVQMSFAQSYQQLEKERKERQKKIKEILGDDGSTENPTFDKERQVSLTAETALLEGFFDFSVEEYESALPKFKRALKINPKSSGINYQIALTLLELKRYSEATEYANAAINLENHIPDYYLLLVKIYQEQGLFGEAARTYEKMFDKKLPNTEIYWKDLAELYHKKLQKSEKALKIYEDLERKYGIMEHINAPKQEIFLEQRNLTEALKEAEKLVKFYPEKPEWQANYAKILLLSGKDAQAEQFLLPKIGSDYTFQTHLQLLQAYQKQNKNTQKEQLVGDLLKNSQLPDEVRSEILKNFVNKTAQNFEQVVKNTPQNAESWLMLAKEAEKQKDFSKAREAYVEVVKLDNNNFEAWKKLLLYDWQLYEIEQLLEHSKEALELYPTQPEIWWYNGKAYFERKNYKKALESYEQGKSFTRKNKSAILETAIAEVYLAENKSKEVENIIAELQPTLNENNDFLNFYAYFLAHKKQKLDEALKIARKIVDLENENGEYLYTLAYVQYRQNKLSDALKTLENALKYKQGAKLQELLGDIYFKMGEKERAISHWQKAQDLKGGSTLLSKKLTDKQLYE
ncbi:tetratricopeptide repeat protein [Raineya orbicola]|jgi:tetratricopeptide (TPR) repeat protein|uniref:TPR repeat n=1 Tax=Raineya orbicola TaxID=2016530 RepID=A0A2N3IC02_9BACT|nr:tetratricopeptide repeat protein [Raineya orbicola]PKQ67827.1 TPR repeat [Raineya orbicola]